MFSSTSRCLRRAGAIGRFAIGVILLSLTACLTGCGGKQTLEGAVTLDGQPLAQGYINFRPMTGAKGSPVGGPVEQGKYSIQPSAALTGPFRVEITAVGKTGKIGIAESGARVELEGQVLPARYNTASELQVEVQSTSRNEFPFSLKSK